jgi:hypothetical protein
MANQAGPRTMCGGVVRRAGERSRETRTNFVVFKGFFLLM